MQLPYQEIALWHFRRCLFIDRKKAKMSRDRRRAKADRCSYMHTHRHTHTPFCLEFYFCRLSKTVKAGEKKRYPFWLNFWQLRKLVTGLYALKPSLRHACMWSIFSYNLSTFTCKIELSWNNSLAGLFWLLSLSQHRRGKDLLTQVKVAVDRPPFSFLPWDFFRFTCYITNQNNRKQLSWWKISSSSAVNWIC